MMRDAHQSIPSLFNFLAYVLHWSAQLSADALGSSSKSAKSSSTFGGTGPRNSTNASPHLGIGGGGVLCLGFSESV